MSVHRMVNSVMPYAWGSRDGIATLQGRRVSSQPEAELWIGAHPQAPSVLEGPSGLRDLGALVESAPDEVLGADVVARFGSRLPFLLKVLSAAEPLSLQVHPNDAVARERFDAEEAAGVERSAAARSYRDPYAKPEMLVALTDFELLLGFRPAREAAATLRGLGVRQLETIAEALEGGMATGDAFLAIVDWPHDERRQLVADVRAAAANSGDERAPWLTMLADRYPEDPGVAGVLLLNYLRLQEWQGVFAAPGQIHAYLQGTGVEIMGSSDNVVRGGLTPKHIAIEE
ncbi:MAG: mannose-6-phosphate isomerase, class I, partial [Acidothermaceae bacterium]